MSESFAASYYDPTKHSTSESPHHDPHHAALQLASNDATANAPEYDRDADTPECAYHENSEKRQKVALSSSEKEAYKATPGEKKRILHISKKLLLLVILLFILALGLGLGLGLGMRKQENRILTSNPPTSLPLDGATTMIATITTTLIDASPIPLPSDLPALPKGVFNLPMKEPSRAELNCLQNADQNSAEAWKCASDTEMQFTVKQPDSGATVISLASYRTKDSKIPYGALPPNGIPESPVSFMLDKDNYEYGPALFFQNSYNKTVVLPDGTFNTTVTRRSAREILGEAHRLHFRDDQPKPGEIAWFCYWNQTIFEGFIYINRDVHTTPAATAPVASSTITPNGGNQQGNRRRAESSSLPSYPKIVKLGERRKSSSPQPYCQQMRIQDNWSAVPVIIDGKPVIMKLQEKASDDKKGSGNQCSCQWMGT